MVDLIDDRITLKLKHPITEEQWDNILDVDFEYTDRIWFQTKHGRNVEFVKASALPEPLTDKEQRIFLAAMGREEKICKETDKECRNCREPYEDSLVWVCKEIVRKVKGALWQT